MNKANHDHLKKLKIMAFPAFKNKSNAYNRLLYTELQNSTFQQNSKYTALEVLEFNFIDGLTKKIDIFHVHWPEFYLNRKYWLKSFLWSTLLLFILIFQKSRGAKIVWTIHNLKPHSTLYPRTNAAFWRIFLKLVDGVCSLSKANHEIAMQQMPELTNKQFAITYHGLYPQPETSISKHDARIKLKLAAQPKIILCLGQVRAYKGYEVLIDLVLEYNKFALTTHKSHEHLLNMVIAGKCPEPDYAAELIKRSQGSEFIELRLDFVSDADLPLYYQAADIAILPYKAIFNSGSALMCVSQGLPVLLPSSPNFEEYKNLLAGSLFTYTSLNISTLKDIFTSQQTTNIDTNKTEISWPCIADRTLELYLKVLNTKKTL